MGNSLDAAARRLRLAFDLFSTGEALMRQRLRGLHPELPRHAVEQRLSEWLRRRPGAEPGDAPGRSVARPDPRL